MAMNQTHIRRITISPPLVYRQRFNPHLPKAGQPIKAALVAMLLAVFTTAINAANADPDRVRID